MGMRGDSGPSGPAGKAGIPVSKLHWLESDINTLAVFGTLLKNYEKKTKKIMFSFICGKLCKTITN